MQAIAGLAAVVLGILAIAMAGANDMMVLFALPAQTPAHRTGGAHCLEVMKTAGRTIAWSPTMRIFSQMGRPTPPNASGAGRGLSNDKDRPRAESQSQLVGSEILASEMASGSAAIQALAGLAAIVLGILAVAGMDVTVLTLVALLALGATLVMSGSTLSGTVMSLMRPSTQT